MTSFRLVPHTRPELTGNPARWRKQSGEEAKSGEEETIQATSGGWKGRRRSLLPRLAVAPPSSGRTSPENEQQRRQNGAATGTDAQTAAETRRTAYRNRDATPEKKRSVGAEGWWWGWWFRREGDAETGWVSRGRRRENRVRFCDVCLLDFFFFFFKSICTFGTKVS